MVKFPDFSGIQKFFLPDDVLVFLRKEIFVFKGVVFDFWSIAHFLSGFFLGNIGFGFATVLFLLVGFEVFEFVLFQQGLIVREDFLNQTVDVLLGLLGWWFGRMTD